MTIDIEKLRKDMEAGTHGPNHSYLAGEYLALREAADALEMYLDYAVNGTWLAYHLDDSREALAAYRKTTQ